MKTLTISNQYLNPISLPGMGRSIDLPGMEEAELMEIRRAFAQKALFVSFTEAPEEKHLVINLWANPHSPQATLFIK